MGEKRPGRPVSPWKDGIRDSMQRRNLKDENISIVNSERRKLCIWLEENCVPTEKFLYIYICVIFNEL
jgi:hypothetical protein